MSNAAKKFIEMFPERGNVIALPVESKACTKCGTVKPLTDFYRVKTTGYYNSECKECHKADCRERNAAWSRNNPEKRRLHQQKQRMLIKADPERHEKYKAMKNKWNRSDKYYDMYYKKRFGITFAEVNSMLAIQNGRCSNIACGCEIAIHPKDNQKKAVVDHCHATGRVRSMMCVKCNTLLGHVENTQSVIFGLLDYLNKYNSKRS